MALLFSLDRPLMKIKCETCSREVEGSPSGAALGGEVYSGQCPEHGNVSQVIANAEADLNSDGRLVCRKCFKESAVENVTRSREIGFGARPHAIHHGRCPEHGPLFHRGNS